MIVVDIKVPATLARLVALWLILVGIGVTGSGVRTALADTPRDAAAPKHGGDAAAPKHGAASASASAAASAAPSAGSPSLLGAVPPSVAADSPANGAVAEPSQEAPPAVDAGTAAVVEQAAPVASGAAPSAPVASSPAPPTAAGSAAPAGSAAHPAANGEAAVRLHDRNVFAIRASLGGQSADARARAASQTLERLLEERELPDVHTEEHAERIVVFGGTTPIVQLGADDAAADGNESLSVHGAAVAAKVREALQSERQRKAIAETVFSVSLFAFSALIAILLLGKVRELAGKLQTWITEHPDRLPSLRFQGIDLVRPAALRGGLSVALSGGRILSQLGIAYGWLLFASSLFESTRTYTERLTGFVLTPLSALIGRVGSALPVLVILGVAVLGTVLLIRFVGLFFGSVARGETTLGSLPRDLALPTGAFLRFGIVIVGLMFAAPLITGADDGALARFGVATLVALGFASAPVLASIVAGIPAIYERRVRVGDHVEIGGRSGRVVAITLLEVRLEDDLGCQIRVPHLSSLFMPTSVLGASPVAVVDLVADPRAVQSHVRSVLLAEARRFGTNVKVEMLRLDGEGAHYRVSARAPLSHGDEDLSTALASALVREEVALGRSSSIRP